MENLHAYSFSVKQLLEVFFFFFLERVLGVSVGPEVPVRLQSFSAGALTAFVSFLHLLVFGGDSFTREGFLFLFFLFPFLKLYIYLHL